MDVWKPVELAFTAAARLGWPAFQAINRCFEGRSFQPKWAAAPLLKSRERSSPQLGWPRTTDSLCPTCVRETRTRILSGEQAIDTLVGQHVGEIKAHIFERDGKVIIEKTCPSHGTFTDTLAINPRVPRAAGVAVSRTRFRRGHRPAAQPRHLLHQTWPRRGADDRSDEPLQHDVRSMLHGRQSGRLRARADARGGQTAARRRGQHQAAAADDGAILRRRADDLADFPRRGPLRARGRVFQRPGGDQRHPVRAGAGVRAAGARSRHAHRATSSSTGSRRRRTRIARWATCSR